MWKPNEKGVKELITLFQDSNSADNNKQKEIYNVKFSCSFLNFNNKENKHLLTRKRF